MRSAQPIVFVHGAWAGGWMYNELAELLREKGHRVFLVTLTGMGERSHLLSADITLDIHVQDVVNTILFNDLEDVVLVGHSYGGMVITGTAGRLGGRIAKLVYIDALVPSDGEAGFDSLPSEAVMGFLAAQKNTPGLIPFPGAQPLDPVAGKRGTRIDYDKLGAQPLLTFLTPVKLTGAEREIEARTFIYATKGAPTNFTATYQRLKLDPDWSVRTIDTGHVIIDEDLVGLAKILAEEAARAE